MSLDFDIKEQVRQACNLVDVANGYGLNLRSFGRYYKALCPWHDDHNPSLQVDPERQTYRCWVCDEGGDIFSFVMKMESVAFPEALQMLAERAGIELRGSSRASGQPSEKTQLYEVLTWAEGQYHKFLKQAAEAEPARRYLADRGILPASIERFRLGFAPNQWDWLVKRAADKGFSARLLEKVGLAVEKRGHFDRFRARLLFPIHDSSGRSIATGGRLVPGIETREAAKYINSPETPLFSKSRSLYGFDLAKNAVRKSNTAVVTEGYTDTIMAHQHGIENAIAVLGTALTEHHVTFLKRFAERIVLVLDGDEAGRRRASDVLKLFLAEQVDLRVLTLPEGLDPCDFLAQRGADAFREAIEQAPDALEHKFQLVSEQRQREGGVHAANRAIEQMLETLAHVPRQSAMTKSAVRIKEDQILNRLSREFAVSETVLRDRLSELRKPAQPRAASVEEPPPEAECEPGDSPSKPPDWEWELLEILVSRPDLLAEIYGQSLRDDLSDPTMRGLLDRMCVMAEEGYQVSFDRLLLEYDDPAVKRLLVALQESADAKNSLDPQFRLRSLMDGVARRKEEEERRRVQRVLQSKRESDAGDAELLRRLVEQRRQEQTRP